MSAGPGPAPDTARWLDQALALHGQGDLDQAEALYQRILAQAPGHFTATHCLGVIQSQRGDHEGAVRLIGAALRANPRSAAAHLNLGLALWHLGRAEEALAHYHYSLIFNPGGADALMNAALALRSLGRPEEALASLDKVLAGHGELPGAHLNRAIVLLDLLRPEEALASVDRALALEPGLAEGHLARGNALRALLRREAALASYDQALALAPDHVDALLNRGSVLLDLGRPGEALAAYDRALALAPGNPEAHTDRGAALLDLKRPLEALAAFDAALALRPDHPDTLVDRGNALLDLLRFDEALAAYDLALARAPEHADALLNRGTLLHLTGRHREAIATFDQALRARPGHAKTHSNKIYVLDYLPEVGFQEHQAERRAYFEAQARILPPARRVHGNDRNPERALVVGYVSADFRRHSAASCFGPVLRRHDRSAVKVVCYSGVLVEDDWTRAFQRDADLWRPMAGLSDDELASLIQADGIDILVDLSGHSLGNRLPVFARKPAPIQVTAWGHGGGTGLPMVDYQFTDPVHIPAQARPLFAEAAFDLPCCITFEAPPLAPPVGPPPALERGLVTFGSLNRFNKISPATLDLWAQVLLAVPGSRLLLKDGVFQDRAVQGRMMTFFSDRGVAPGRLELRGATTQLEHLAAYGDVDLVLDTFPQNGGITTWEALWMGVPVLAMLGGKSSSRISGAILQALGLQAWIARDEAHYLELAVRAAGDPGALGRLRQGLRGRIGESSAGDPERYTRAVEAAYRVMWHRWLAQ